MTEIMLYAVDGITIASSQHWFNIRYINEQKNETTKIYLN